MSEYELFKQQVAREFQTTRKVMGETSERLDRRVDRVVHHLDQMGAQVEQLGASVGQLKTSVGTYVAS